MFLADSVDEVVLEEDEAVMEKVDWSRRGRMESEVEDWEETALPKKVKTQLRRSLSEMEKVQETLAVSVSS